MKVNAPTRMWSPLFLILVLGLAGCGSAMNNAMTAGGSQNHARALTCSAPRSPSGRVVRVALSDMAMSRMMGGVAPVGARMTLEASPSSVSAGEVTFVVSNIGWRTHELVVLPLAAAAREGQRVAAAIGKVSEIGSAGEASNSCVGGTGEGITSGSVGWVTLTLRAGRYELVCNLPNHYADGMHQELVVT